MQLLCDHVLSFTLFFGGISPLSFKQCVSRCPNAKKCFVRVYALSYVKESASPWFGMTKHSLYCRSYCDGIFFPVIIMNSMWLTKVQDVYRSCGISDAMVVFMHRYSSIQIRQTSIQVSNILFKISVWSFVFIAAYKWKEQQKIVSSYLCDRQMAYHSVPQN